MILIPQKQKLLNLNLNLIMPSVLTTSFKISKPEKKHVYRDAGRKMQTMGKTVEFESFSK